MWLTESIRLTAFTQPPDVDVGVNWWQTLAGEPPSAHSVQRLGPVLRQHGPIQNAYCNLSLEYQPGRVDWVMSAIVPPELKFEGFPNFGLYENATARFKELVLKWFSNAPPFKRLAVGSVLLIPVADKVEGYREIQKFLPAITLDAENSADFLYSINRPRQSRAIQGLRINRLARWSVARLSGIQIQLGNAGATQAIESPEGLSAIRLELDINTQPERIEPLPSRPRQQLFEELLGLNIEIAEKGDVP